LHEAEKTKQRKRVIIEEEEEEETCTKFHFGGNTLYTLQHSFFLLTTTKISNRAGQKIRIPVQLL